MGGWDGWGTLTLISAGVVAGWVRVLRAPQAEVVEMVETWRPEDRVLLTDPWPPPLTRFLPLLFGLNGAPDLFLGLLGGAEGVVLADALALPPALSLPNSLRRALISAWARERAGSRLLVVGTDVGAGVGAAGGRTSLGALDGPGGGVVPPTWAGGSEGLLGTTTTDFSSLPFFFLIAFFRFRLGDPSPLLASLLDEKSEYSPRLISP